MSDFDPKAYLEKRRGAAAAPAGGFDPAAYLAKRKAAQAPEEKGAFDTVVDTIDSYTGAPSRAAVHAVQKGENPLSAFWDQLGEDPSKGPHGVDITRQAGVSHEPLVALDKQAVDDVSNEEDIDNYALDPMAIRSGTDANAIRHAKAAAGKVALTPRDEAAGLGVDLIADWTNFAPVGKIAEGLGKLGVGAADVARAAPKVVGEIAEKGIKATAEGLKGVKAENMAGSAARGSGAAILDLVERTKPKLSSGSERLAKVAESIGLAPEEISHGVKYGRDSDLSRISKVLGEMPGGEAARDVHNATSTKIQRAMSKGVDSLAHHRMASVADTIEAGKAVTNDFSKAQDALRGQIDFDRSMVYKSVPGIELTEAAHTGALKAIDKHASDALQFAEGAIDDGLKTQARNASNVLAGTFKNLSQSATMEAAHGELQKLGKIAFGQSSMKPEIKGMLQGAYFDLAKTYDGNATKLLGPEIGARIEHGNKLWSDFYKSNEDFAKTLSSGADPEVVFKRLKRGGSGELEKYVGFMKSHNPEGLDNFKSLFMKDLVHGASNADGLNFGKFLDTLEDPDVAGRLKLLFKPEELEQFKGVAELGREHGSAIFNTSRTETARGLKEAGKSVAERAQLEAYRDMLMRRAENPKGIPMSDVLAGKRYAPEIAPAVNASKKGEVSLDALATGAKGAQNVERLMNVIRSLKQQERR